MTNFEKAQIASNLVVAALSVTTEKFASADDALPRAFSLYNVAFTMLEAKDKESTPKPSAMQINL